MTSMIALEFSVLAVLTAYHHYVSGNIDSYPNIIRVDRLLEKKVTRIRSLLASHINSLMHVGNQS